MAGDKKVAPPIDRPLSKAYLRKFTGWSTANPPGMSDPTSLRVMHNCNVDADSSLRVRPGLRRIFTNITAVPAGGIVGSFEHFYASDGSKCLLFAVREDDLTVGFRVAKLSGSMYTIETLDTQFTITGDVSFSASTSYVKYVQIDNKILALAETTNVADTFLLFSVGETKVARELQAINVPEWTTADKLDVYQPDDEWRTVVPQVTVPTSAGTITDSLTDETLEYNVGYWYTFVNEIGETAPSAVTVMQIDKTYTTWTADASDDRQSPQQLAAVIPSAVFEEAWYAGATAWNLYFMYWSDQDVVPVVGVLMKTTTIDPDLDLVDAYDQCGWATHTPLMQGEDNYMSIPSASNLVNYTEPFTTGNGLVAGDRMVLVYDKLNAARIRWSSNQQGNYLNLSATAGGGYKTLTSGDLYFPATVKLWQNPQSVDTLTVLCMGLDGEGTSYYMNANTAVTSQSQNTTIMGFEETTATPGTVAPYGCEVLNNSLYHPLDNDLMKSTASNYNINHTLLAGPIQNLWRAIPLSSKRRIVSSQMDSTLYYLVKGPAGTYWSDDSENTGTQIWLLDTGKENIWSCWDVDGSSLRKLEIGGQLYMAVTRGRCIYILDPEKDNDDVWAGPLDDDWVEAGIPWEARTNTQGANRSHDAWCFLQQVNVTFGNFTGECEYGIRGYDVNGKLVEVKKHYTSPQLVSHDPLNRYDQHDFLKVSRVLMEWEFFWKSAERPKNRSYGSISFVQYRYTPITVNVGYEYGSVESFEYGSRLPAHSNGVPIPFADTTLP